MRKNEDEQERWKLVASLKKVRMGKSGINKVEMTNGGKRNGESKETGRTGYLMSLDVDDGVKRKGVNDKTKWHKTEKYE